MIVNSQIAVCEEDEKIWLQTTQERTQTTQERTHQEYASAQHQAFFLFCDRSVEIWNMLSIVHHTLLLADLTKLLISVALNVERFSWNMFTSSFLLLPVRICSTLQTFPKTKKNFQQSSILSLTTMTTTTQSSATSWQWSSTSLHNNHKPVVNGLRD